MQNILGHIKPGLFLRDYWQTRLLLVRNAIKNPGRAINGDTLAGLALEDNIRSRIVQQTDNPRSWLCRYGPFDEQDFARLPETHWTLLVQDVDKHLPYSADILEYFSFLPRWRIDDLMISYAVDGGSVGPHTDQYDVFLIQASGQRKWLLQADDIDSDNLLENTELQILKNFNPETEYLLNPGDMLYLPPGIAHYGIAIGECITFSVGFRAPSQADLLQAYAEQFSLHTDKPQFYRDTDPGSTGRSELTLTDIAHMHQLMMQTVDNEALMIRAIGNLLTTPTDTPSLHEMPDMGPGDFTELLGKTSSISLHPATRCIYINDENGVILYVNATEYRFGDSIKTLIIELCDMYRQRKEPIGHIMQDQQLLPLLHDLYQQGYLYLENTNI